MALGYILYIISGPETYKYIVASAKSERLGFFFGGGSDYFWDSVYPLFLQRNSRGSKSW